MKTMKEKCLLKNEDGSVLVLALVMLVLLTLLGIAASRTSSIEIQVSGNDTIYKQNLYMAEAGAMEAAQELEDTDLETSPPAWLHAIGTLDEDTNIPDAGFWTDANSKKITGITNLPNTRLLAVSEGIAAGGSLDMSKSNVNSYATYGRCELNRGVIVIKVGYRKAF
jgi:Tfp pilus assembly protein PilX